MGDNEVIMVLILNHGGRMMIPSRSRTPKTDGLLEQR